MDNESAVIKEIYNLINEIKIKTNYTKEINDIDKKIENIKNARSELINMRARKEIDSEEYNFQREKYNFDLSMFEKKKQEYLSLIKEDNYKDNIDSFYKKIKGIIIDDEESLFKIFGSIVDTIYVEKLEEENYTNKIMLHFKLNILSYNSILNLNDFLLLYSNSEGCCSSHG